MPGEDFPYIRAWGAILGSHQYYVDGEVQAARDTGAPHTAVYRRTAIHTSHRDWVALEDLRDPHARQRLLDVATERGFG